MIAAGGPAPLPVAVLVPATESAGAGSNVSVLVDGKQSIHLTNECKKGSFAAAKAQPSFAGATADGHLVIINCASKASAAVCKDVGVSVARVIAMLEQKVVFVCNEHNVWFYDAAILVSTSAPARPVQLGTAAASQGHAVAAFASASVLAFAVGTDAAPECCLADLGGSVPELVLAAPASVRCCRADCYSYENVALIAAGSYVAAAETNRRTSPRCKMPIIYSSQTSPVKTVAVTKEGLLCLKEDDSVSAARKDEMHGIFVVALHRNVSAITDTGTVVCL